MAQTLIELKNVNVSLEGRRVLHELNWKLERGQNWAISGSNGSGKSTFLKLLRGDLWPDSERPGLRRYWVEGRWQESSVGFREQSIWLAPDLQRKYLTQEWTVPVWYVVQTGFHQGDYLYQPLSSEQKQTAEALLDQLGIAHLRKRSIQALSTGELRRVLIARALVQRPDFLFLDEFTDGLDTPSRRNILEAVQRAAEQGSQVLFTTHRKEELFPAITHLLHLEEGRVKRQREYKPAPLPKARSPVSTAFFPPARPGFVFRAWNADVWLDSGRVLCGINWTIRPGERWVVTGRNGCGKSTLLKLLAGELYASQESVVERFDGKEFETIWDLKKRIGYLSADLQTFYDPGVTGRAVIASGFFSSVGVHCRLNHRQRARVRNLINRFAAASLQEKPMGELSFGQQRKILFLRTLVHDPDLVILDEPFDGLDESACAEFQEALNHLASQGKTIVLVTHHPEEIPSWVTHHLELQQGKIIRMGAHPHRDALA